MANARTKTFTARKVLFKSTGGGSGPPLDLLDDFCYGCELSLLAPRGLAH